MTIGVWNWNLMSFSIFNLLNFQIFEIFQIELLFEFISPPDLENIYFEDEDYEVEVEAEPKVTTIAKVRDHSGYNRPVRFVEIQ